MPTVFSCVASRNKRKENPAPGYRDSTSGTPVGISNYGYSWLSVSFDASDHYRGMYLRFSTTELVPDITGHSASGRQLRCLSE